MVDVVTLKNKMHDLTMPFERYIDGIPFKIKNLIIRPMDKEAVFQELRRKIFQKELSPGQWLVERDISGTYKISRTPVREILRRLSVEGLVTLEPAKGYMVKQLNVEEIIEIRLTDEEKKALDHSADAVRKLVQDMKRLSQ